MSLDISYRLHTTTGQPDRSVLLPELPGAGEHSPPMFDRMGEALQGAWPIVAAGSIGGGVIGSKLLRLGGGGIFRGIIGGIAGVLGGAALTMGTMALLRGNDHAKPVVPDGAVQASTEVATREHVKVMTWNIHGGMGGPGEYGGSEEEMDKLAEVIRREQPDIVLLQEVDDFAPRSTWSDNLAELDERLDPTSTVAGGAATNITGRDQHTAIMTFHGFEVEDARNVIHQDPRGGGFATRTRSLLNQGKGVIDHFFGTELEQQTDDYQVRNTMEGLVRTPGGSTVRVLSGHYEWPNGLYDHQDLQVGDMSRAIAAWHGPTIWGADFNIRDGVNRGAIERRLMAAAGLHDTFGDTPEYQKVSMVSGIATAVEGDPSAAEGGIDRIYASDHAKVLGTRVVREAADASDHLPVVTELELEPGA
jgi:endonuclease/exonuclease/phosphatase family metal-dependent hydrolase